MLDNQKVSGSQLNLTLSALRKDEKFGKKQRFT
jgi:hypothetical protein